MNVFFEFYFFLKRGVARISLLILSLTLSDIAYSSNVLILNNSSESIIAAKELGYQWDSDNKLSLENILSDSIQKKFKYSQSSVLNFGISHHGLWLKIEIKNQHPELKQNYMLEVAYPHLDTLEFYTKNEKGEWEKILTGDKTSFTTRPIEARHFVFPVSFSDTIAKTFYFYVGGEGSRQFPLYIQSSDRFYISQTKVDIIYGGAFFGILLVMLFYNLFIFYSLKERVYLYYALMNITVIMVYISYSGYGFQYLWRDYSSLNAEIIPLSVLLHGFTGTVFTRNFLETRKYIPLMNKLLTWLLYSYLVIICVSLFANYELSLRLAVIMAFINSALVLISSYRVWMKGNKFAQFMALSFSIYLVGILLLSSNIGGYLPRSFFIAHSMEVGTVIEITLLSFALGYKYSNYRKEKEEAQNKLLNVQMKINEELEQKVNERTQEINLQKAELQELNKVKDKLLSVISHDLRGPVNATQALVAMMRKDKATEDNLNMYSIHLNNKINTMSGLLENMLQWIKSQKEGLKFNLENIRLKDIVDSVMSVVSCQAELKSIIIIDEIHPDVILKADKNVLQLVLRNLLNNAIKFTENGGKVFISARLEEEYVIVDVRDTGIGIDEVKVKMLFNNDTHFTTPDTSKKEGAGLGLLLCKDFISRIAGDIWVESEVGCGSSFKFKLPKAN